MNPLRSVLGIVAGIVVIVGYTAPAAACETDDDCGAGYVCTTYDWGTTDCDYSMPDCEDGDEACLEDAEMSMEDCETQTVTESYCQRAPCETDADCGEAMVCIEHVEEWCTGSGMEVCDENGEECEVIEEEEECGTDVYRECGYPYEGGCEQDADCGEGFACVPREICSCSSGGDMDTDEMYDGEDMESGGDGEVPEMPEGDFGEASPGDEANPPECTCEPTGDNYCELQPIDCEIDADCPAGLLCSPSYSISECEETPDGEEICTETETVSQCEPEGWYGEDWDDGDDVSGDADGEKDEEDEEADQDDNDDQGETEGDGDIGSGSGWGWGWGSPWGPRGCSVVAPGAGNTSGVALIGLLGLLAVALRRRR